MRECLVDAVSGLSAELIRQVQGSDVVVRRGSGAFSNGVVGDVDGELLGAETVVVALVVDVDLRVHREDLGVGSRDSEGSIAGCLGRVQLRIINWKNSKVYGNDNWGD